MSARKNARPARRSAALETREGAVEKWRDRVDRWLRQWLPAHPILGSFRSCAAVIFYGSLTRGFDDEFADVDLWALLPEERLPSLDALSATRFFELRLDGKEGHVTVHGVAEFADKVHRCCMDTIFQLRASLILTDPCGVAAGLRAAASAPMPRDVRRAFFMHHYMEMRSEHRACDNPMERRDPVALLLSLPKVLAHALRAAMVLDGEPYPYDKWLHFAARQTPTGQRLAPHVENVLDLLARDLLRFPGREREHPIGLELRAIRGLLVDAARQASLDEPWLDKWWLYMDEDQRQFAQVRWPMARLRGTA